MGLKYMTPKEATQKWGISQRRVHTLCLEGRIKGAERHGWAWLIPETAEKPIDLRIKSGRYVKRGQGLDTGQARPGAGDGSQNPFFIPAPPDNAVLRPRLIERIGPPGSLLTYIYADAGYGKTTLLMQYAGGRSGVAWISLDERDANAAYFLHHLEDAIREKLSRFDFHTTDLIPFANGGAFIPTAVSALLKALGCRKLILILDDVHLLADSASADLLSRLARNCPPNLTLVMAGRHQLWSGLFRLKADGKSLK